MNNYIATCKFGLEALVADELRAIGASDVEARDARVLFSGEWDVMCRANIELRTADRVFLLVGAFKAVTFDELFEGTRALPWENILARDSAFPVKGKSARSTLFSVSDCQSIVKKAIVERLKSRYKADWFSETGKRYIIEVGILNDEVTLCLDASGAGLNRRGYRTLNAEAPLAETLAAALVKLSRYKGEESGAFRDPMCGSGTIAIEAAMIAAKRAPGLMRRFAAEEWTAVPKQTWLSERQRAGDAVLRDARFDITGSDIDRHVIELARIHAAQAGVKVDFKVADAREFKPDAPRGVIVTNPPYGERLMNARECERLYTELGRAFLTDPEWKVFVLTALPNFERLFGKRADKTRKLYNSGIQCRFYQYFKR